MTFLIKKWFYTYKRPYYLNANYAGMAFGPKYGAKKFESREEAESLIARNGWERCEVEECKGKRSALRSS